MLAVTLGLWDMMVVVCSVARTRVDRILEESVAGVSAASHYAGAKGEDVSLAGCARRLVSCGGSGPFG